MGSWNQKFMRRFLFSFFKLSLIFLTFLVESPDKSWAAPDNKDNSYQYSFSHNDHIYRGPDLTDEFTEMTSKVIAGILIFVVLASFIAFLVCLCCPICLLAKMRQRRRGFVYQTASNNGVVAVQNGGETSVTVSQNTTPAQVAVVTTTNNRNAPYPVQQSVTVVPIQQPQHYPPNSMGYPVVPAGNAPPYQMGHGAMSMPTVGMPDLPPPYPGLPRETAAVQQQQPAYNPYFGGDEASAPNPYMTTTAPYPSKN